MGYSYEHEKSVLFTEKGSQAFLDVRDEVRSVLAVAGAFRPNELAKSLAHIESRIVLLSIDRMLELGELREVGSEGEAGRSIYRVLVRRGLKL